MITNTCLTGGSFVSGWPAAELVGDPDSSLPDCPSDSRVVAVCVGVVVVAAEVSGVFEAPVSGSSELPCEELVDPSDAELPVAGALAITRTCSGWDAASESRTPELAALPISTPKPRNPSTSSADTHGEGSLSAGMTGNERRRVGAARDGGAGGGFKRARAATASARSAPAAPGCAARRAIRRGGSIAARRRAASRILRTGRLAARSRWRPYSAG